MRVAIIRSHQLVGGAVSLHLQALGHQVVTMTSSSSGRGAGDYYYDMPSGWVDLEALEGRDAILVFRATGFVRRSRWSPADVASLITEDLDRFTTLAAAMSRLRRPPKLFLIESSVSWYGSRGDRILTEASTRGSGAVPAIVEAWEGAAQAAAAAGCRVVLLRTDRMLDAAAGYLARELRRFRRGAGGRLGSGDQYISWISLPDLLSGLLHVMNDEALAGPVNLTSPRPVTQAEFARALARAVRRPALARLPAAALEASMGRQQARETVLASQRAVPARLLDSGFRFEEPDVADAIQRALRRAPLRVGRGRSDIGNEGRPTDPVPFVHASTSLP
jgi:uncharacterized protein